jgi:hypothetical protein
VMSIAHRNDCYPHAIKRLALTDMFTEEKQLHLKSNSQSSNHTLRKFCCVNSVKNLTQQNDEICFSHSQF